MEFHRVHGEQGDSPAGQKNAYKEVIGMLEGNILRNQADKEVSKGKPGEAQLGKTFANEMESNVCPICLELMIPPKNKPILLFPCGHTFCNVCLTQNEKWTRMKICSLCKKAYSHSAVNIALQNLICLFTDNRQLIGQEADREDEVESSNVGFYREKLGQLDMRLGLLRASLNDSSTSLAELRTRLKSTEAAEKILLREKVDAQEELAQVQAKLELVERQLEEFSGQKDRLVERLAEEQDKLKVLAETIDGLNEERVKVSILMNEAQ